MLLFIHTEYDLTTKRYDIESFRRLFEQASIHIEEFQKNIMTTLDLGNYKKARFLELFYEQDLAIEYYQKEARSKNAKYKDRSLYELSILEMDR